MDALPQIDNQQDNFQLKRFTNLIIGRWYWIIGFLLVCLGVAYFIIRYASPVYVVSSSFITKKFTDQGNNSGFLRLAEEAGSFGGGQIQAFQEIPLLKSQSRIQETLNRVDFDVSYFIQGQFKTSEVYPTDYYKVEQFESSTNHPYGISIYIDANDEKQYELSTNDASWQSLFENKKFIFGSPHKVNGWEFKISAKNSTNGVNQHFFTINNPGLLVNEYRNRLQLDWQIRGSSILIASVHSQLPPKDVDFLNTYFEVVVQKGLEEKSEQITNVINFINSYVPQISDTLLSYQKRLDHFKLENKDVITGAEGILERLKELETEKSDLMISNWYYDHILTYIRDKKGEKVFAPVLFGLREEPLSILLNDYLEAKWDDKFHKNELNNKNPLVNKSNEVLERLEKNIFESVKNLKADNYRKISEINQKINLNYSTVGDLQVETREYAELTRMISLYESVFDNLITRRTDAFLSQASVVSDYQMVTDPNYNASEPISPDKEKLIIIAIFIGLGVPLSVLYILSISNNKVVSKNDLLQNSSIPILGYVGHSPEKDNLVVFNTPKSLVAESFRRIRANLQYFSDGDGNGKHVLLITSSISAEGKTFCSVNLAFTYALSGKKTVIVGADMRKPTLAKSFGLSKEKGLSNYLAGQCDMDDVIYPSGNEDLQIIPGGSIPPNPAELILTARMKSLMNYLKRKYDLVIIDTPPMGLVADAIELMDFSDLNLLIVRQNVTFKKSLHETTENYEKGQLKKMTILFNDVNFQKLEYGYKAYIEGYQSYGYGYKSGYFEDEKA